nr:hypothetical protein [Tanacetum cinerariifolium]
MAWRSGDEEIMMVVFGWSYGGEVATWVEMVAVVELCCLGGGCGEVVVKMVMLVAPWSGFCHGVTDDVVAAVVA